MREVLLTFPVEHTKTSLTYRQAKFRFECVTEDFKDLERQLSYSDQELLIFGHNAQLAGDFLMKNLHGTNLKIRAAELQSCQLNDLCSDSFSYCKEMSEITPIGYENLLKVLDKRTLDKKGPSQSISRVFEINRCCYNADCKQTHGSLRIYIAGLKDMKDVKDFCAGRSCKINDFISKQCDVIACCGAENMDDCMEALFLLENQADE